MAGKVLTATLLDSIKPPAAGRLEIADLRCSGLAFRITKAGARSWNFRFRDPNNAKTTRATIGTYPDVGLAKARERADKMRGQVAAGINPTHRKRALQATAASRTYRHLAERYMTEHAERKKRARSIADDRRNLDKHILLKWSGLAFASITRADVVELVEGLITAGKPVLANRVQALISKIFSFGIDAGLLEANPCQRLGLRGAETAGDRVLSDPEIRLFWDSIIVDRRSNRPLPAGLALRLALVTGTRRSEVAGISRDELHDISNASGAVWTIPGARTKNGRAHAIPLPPMARSAVLELLDMIDSDERFLLPTESTKRQGHVRPESLTRAMARFGKRMKGEDAAVTTWKANPPSPHDLRRSLETRMAALGIAKDIRDKVLNHVAADVGSVHYDRHSYLPEKRAALTRWNDALAAILNQRDEGAAVIPFSRSIDG